MNIDHVLEAIIVLTYFACLAVMAWTAGRLLVLVVEWLADEFERRGERRACKQTKRVP